MKMKHSEDVVEGIEFDGDLSIASKDIAKIINIVARDYKHDSTPIREAIINGLEATEGIEGGRVTFDMSTQVRHEQSPFSSSDGDVSSATITVSDNGTGMSREEVEQYFLNVGWSSKDNDEHATGGFGIGTRAVMALTDVAVWITTRDGETTTFYLARNKGAFSHKMETVTTGKPNGTTLSFNVSGDRFKNIESTIVDDYLGFADPERVTYTINGIEQGSVGKYINNASRIGENVMYSDTPLSMTVSKRVVLVYNGAPYDVTDTFRSANRVLFNDISGVVCNGYKESLRVDAEHYGNKKTGHNHTIYNGTLVVYADGGNNSFDPLANREGIRATEEAYSGIMSIVKQGIKAAAKKLAYRLTNPATPQEWIESYAQAIALPCIRGAQSIRVIEADYKGKALFRESRYDSERKNWDVLGSSDITVRSLISGGATVFPIWENYRKNESVEGYTDPTRFGGVIGAFALEGVQASLEAAKQMETLEEFAGFSTKYMLTGLETVPDGMLPRMVETNTVSEIVKYLFGDSAANCVNYVSNPEKYREVLLANHRRATDKKTKAKKKRNEKTARETLAGSVIAEPENHTLAVYANDEIFGSMTNKMFDVTKLVSEIGAKRVIVTQGWWCPLPGMKTNSFRYGQAVTDKKIAQALANRKTVVVATLSEDRQIKMVNTLKKKLPKLDMLSVVTPSQNKDSLHSLLAGVVAEDMGLDMVDAHVIHDFLRLDVNVEHFSTFYKTFAAGYNGKALQQYDSLLSHLSYDGGFQGDGFAPFSSLFSNLALTLKREAHNGVDRGLVGVVNGPLVAGAYAAAKVLCNQQDTRKNDKEVVKATLEYGNVINALKAGKAAA